MSKEAVTEFLTKMEGDQATQSAVKSTLEGSKDQLGSVVEAASNLGFTFTTQEFVEVVDLLTRADSGALTDDELSAIAGGMATSDARKKRVQVQQHALRNFDLSQIPK